MGNGVVGRVGRVQFTANQGQEWMGIRATTLGRDFQGSKKGLTGIGGQRGKRKGGGASKKGVAKGEVSMRLNVYIMLIKDCVKVINKPCVQDSRYVRLILWIPRCGSKQLCMCRFTLYAAFDFSPALLLKIKVCVSFSYPPRPHPNLA
jgi:hypothetical protein